MKKLITSNILCYFLSRVNPVKKSKNSSHIKPYDIMTYLESIDLFDDKSPDNLSEKGRGLLLAIEDAANKFLNK